MIDRESFAKGMRDFLLAYPSFGVQGPELSARTDLFYRRLAHHLTPRTWTILVAHAIDSYNAPPTINELRDLLAEIVRLDGETLDRIRFRQAGGESGQAMLDAAREAKLREWEEHLGLDPPTAILPARASE